MNVTELITVIRDYVDEPGTDPSDWSDTELLRYINLEHRHVISMYRQFYEDYLGREHIFLANTSDRYYLPIEFLTARRVEIIQNAAAVTGTFPNFVVNEQEARTEDVGSIELNSKDVPAALNNNSRVRALEGYYLFGNQIIFVPGNRLNGKYVRIYHNQLSADLHRAFAQDGSSSTITLGIAAAPSTLGAISKVNNYYKDMIIEIVSGSGAGQFRYITQYDGTTQIATVHENWTTAPDSSSVYSINSPVPYDYHEVLALGATMRAKGIKTEDDAQAVVLLYNTLLGEMKTALESRNVSSSRRVNATRELVV